MLLSNCRVLTAVAFRTTKNLSTLGDDILIDRTCQSYQNPVNDGVDIPVDCNFQSCHSPVNFKR